MCGIIGMIEYDSRGFYAKDRDFFVDLLIFNSVRGSHSTGVFGGNWYKNPDYVKAVGNPFDLLDQFDMKTFSQRMLSKYKFVVGHGRHATRGEVKAENAHPFQIDHITMVHNGTVRESTKVKVEEHAVDSKAIAQALSEHHPEEVIPDIEGAFALAWHNNKTGSIYLARNSQRPLWIARLSPTKFAFASELNMIRVAAARNDLEIVEVKEVPEMSLVEFSQDKKMYTIEKLVKPVIIPEKKEPCVLVKRPPQTNPARIVSIMNAQKMRVFREDKVYFTVSDIVMMNQLAKNPTWQVFGDIGDIPIAECSFVYRGEEVDLLEDCIWEGTIKNIVESHREGYEFHLYLGDVQKIPLVIDDAAEYMQ